MNGSEADTTAAQDYIREFTYLTITECANYKASDDELSTYGLDAPTAVIQIRWEESDEDGNTASCLLYTSLENRMLACTVGNEMRSWQDALKCFFENWKPED